jgi:hypothetical protein
MLFAELAAAATLAGGLSVPLPTELLLALLVLPLSPPLSDEQAKNINAKAMQIAAERTHVIAFIETLLF